MNFSLDSLKGRGYHSPRDKHNHYYHLPSAMMILPCLHTSERGVRQSFQILETLILHGAGLFYVPSRPSFDNFRRSK